MQAWELERELGRAQDKIEAIKNLKKNYCSLETCEGCGMNGACFPQSVLKILEDQSSGDKAQ